MPFGSSRGSAVHAAVIRKPAGVFFGRGMPDTTVLTLDETANREQDCDRMNFEVETQQILSVGPNLKRR